MLEKERFLEIKRLAQEIRRENEGLFKAFKMESPEDAIKEKEEFMETIIDSLEGSFSDGENGREEKQIFRANVLIPDDENFLETYSKDKNIRNLMNTYSVGIEDVMSKITELNIYADYLAPSKVEENKVEEKSVIEEKPIHYEEPEYKMPEYKVPDTKEEKDDDFVDAMVNLSSGDAQSLLDEIENLSNVMAEFNIPEEDKVVPKPVIEEKPVVEEKPVEEPKHFMDIKLPDEINFKEEPKPAKEIDYSSDMSIDDISEAVDGFVDDYNSIQIDLDKLRQELKSSNELVNEQKDQIKSLREEAYSLRKNNLESVKSLKEARNENERLVNENYELNRKLTAMEEQIKRTSALLKKIYNSIPRK